MDDNSHAIQFCPDYSLSYYYRAISYCMKGDLLSGIDDLPQTIKLDPKNAEAYYNRGLAYEQFKNDNMQLKIIHVHVNWGIRKHVIRKISITETQVTHTCDVISNVELKLV